MQANSRCVECGQPQGAHLKAGRCPPPNTTTFKTMDLPEGAHCRDCIHIRFCTQLIGDVADNESCDWYPSRFCPSSAVERG